MWSHCRGPHTRATPNANAGLELPQRVLTRAKPLGTTDWDSNLWELNHGLFPEKPWCWCCPRPCETVFYSMIIMPGVKLYELMPALVSFLSTCLLPPLVMEIYVPCLSCQCILKMCILDFCGLMINGVWDLRWDFGLELLNNSGTLRCKAFRGWNWSVSYEMCINFCRPEAAEGYLFVVSPKGPYIEGLILKVFS